MIEKIVGLILILLSLGSNAQTYFSDDFSSGNLDNWTIVDADGDNSNWSVASYEDDPQEEHASSKSWDSVPLSPDNWMISNAIDLANASNAFEILLSWKVYAQDQNWANENYTVYVSKYNQIDSLTNAETFFSEVIGMTDGYQSRSIDLTAFAGEDMVYIAFRHHNVSDMYRLNIDDIRVFTPVDNDLEISSITVDSQLDGDRAFSVSFTNNGVNNVTGFQFEWSFGTANGNQNISGVNLATGDSYTFVVDVAGVEIGTDVFEVNITTNDEDMSNNSLQKSFSFQPPVIPFVGIDSEGNNFDLYQTLESGQAVLIDFMTSSSQASELATIEIAEWIQNNGAGNGSVQAIALTIDENDGDAILNGLNWNGEFYDYPKFAFSDGNLTNFVHYGTEVGLNTGGFVPFFVLICPNILDPGHSTIIKTDVGFFEGLFGEYEEELNNCSSAVYLDIAKHDLLNDIHQISIYPNPVDQFATIQFELIDNQSVIVEVVNAVGQTLQSQKISNINGTKKVLIDLSFLDNGVYFINMVLGQEKITKKIFVMHPSH